MVLGVANAKLEAALEDAIAHGAKAVTIFASGLVAGDESGELARRIGARARAAGVALCGGNGMGFYNLDRKLRVVAYSSALDMRSGPITFIAQSGSAFGALSHNDRRLGFNLAVSSGGEWATSAADYLDWALEQPTTATIGLFLEAVRDPAAFVGGLAKAAAKGIPIVVLKVGRTPESAAMALSHTGALAGSDAAFEALFDRYGVIRVDDEDELAATLLLLSHPRKASARWPCRNARFRWRTRDDGRHQCADRRAVRANLGTDQRAARGPSRSRSPAGEPARCAGEPVRIRGPPSRS